MNVKLRRLVRTPNSEQYALFDLDQIDGEQQPVTIGKLDLHYTGEGVYGTLLLWDAVTRSLKPAQRDDFVNTLLAELTQPMGVPNEYVVEFFRPDLEEYELFHNVAVDGEAAAIQEVAGRNRTASPIIEPDRRTARQPTQRGAPS